MQMDALNIINPRADIRGFQFELEDRRSKFSLAFGITVTKEGIYVFFNINGESYHLSLHRIGEAHIKYYDKKSRRDVILKVFREPWFGTPENTSRTQNGDPQRKIRELLERSRGIFLHEPRGEEFILLIYSKSKALQAILDKGIMQMRIRRRAKALMMLGEDMAECIEKSMKKVLRMYDYKLPSIVRSLGEDEEFIAISKDGSLIISGAHPQRHAYWL